jgi:4'-phosphopantetheinyl transferase EntD
MKPLLSIPSVETLPDSAALAALFGPGFAAEVAVPRLVNDALFPDERQHIARAVAKRQAEFGTARLCARQVLARLGLPPCSLVPHADRSPRWPDGVIGSISHTEGCCAVVATTAPGVIGCGLDIERDAPLSTELEPLICTATERSWLDGEAPESRGRLGKLVFSAKEAFYKCQYRTTRTLIDFQEVELAIDPQGGFFRVAALAREGPVWDRVRPVRGKFRWMPGYIVTAAVLIGDVR